ncbi:MAG: hypothetical protein ACPGAN_00985 [Candidatus Poseidoniaceae archaeon]
MVKVRSPSDEDEKIRARIVIENGGGISIEDLFLKYGDVVAQQHHMDRFHENILFLIEIEADLNLENIVKSCMDLDRLE